MAPKFLQRIHFSPGAKPGRGDAKPAIVQYHPQANTEFAKRQGYVLATVEPWAVEHGASLAAGPAALDLLERLVELSKTGPGFEFVSAFESLLDEAKDLLDRAKPPLGSVNENGTPRQVPETALPHEREKSST